MCLVNALNLHIQSNAKQLYKPLIFIAIEGANLIQKTTHMCKRGQNNKHNLSVVKLEVGTCGLKIGEGIQVSYKYTVS